MNYIWAVMILVGIAYGTLTGQVETVSEAVLASAKEAVSLGITMLGVVALWSGLMEVAKDSGLIDGISQKMRPLIHFLFPDIPKGHPAAEHITMNCVANFLGLGWAATPAGLRAMEALEELEEERRRAEKDRRSEDKERRRAEMDRRSEDKECRSTEDLKMQKMKTERKKTKTAGIEPTKRKSGVSGKAVHGARAVQRGTANNEMCTFLILNISSLQLIPVNIIAYRAQYGSVNPSAVIAPGIAATAVSTGVAVIYCKLMEKQCGSKI